MSNMENVATKSRVIKFRAWDGQDYMTKPFTLLDIQNGRIQFASSDTAIMQFTGLTDKNGKEIYEGDILFYQFDNLNESVKWDLDNGCWTTSENGLCGDDLTYNAEVVGNIYENLLPNQ